MEPNIKKILDDGQGKLPDLIRSAKTSAYYAIAFGISLFLISLALTAYLSLKWNGSLNEYIFLGIGVISLIASFILLLSYAASIKKVDELHDEYIVLRDISAAIDLASNLQEMTITEYDSNSTKLMNVVYPRTRAYQQIIESLLSRCAK